MKILTNKQAVEIMTKYDSLRIQNNIYKAENKKLKAENDALKEALRSKTVFVDFPATEKLHEDKIY